MLDDVVLGLRTPDLDGAVDATGREQAGRGVGLDTVDDVAVRPVHLRYEVGGALPDVEVAIVRPGNNVVGVVAEEVGLLDVSRCVAVAQEAILVVPRCHAPVLGGGGRRRRHWLLLTPSRGCAFEM